MLKFQTLLFALLAIMVVLPSCNEDAGSITITYQEATAVYGDLDEVRNRPLYTGAREIVDAGKIYVAQDYILIGEETEGIHVVDNTDRNAPYNVGFINIPGNREFLVDGNFLYAESYYDVVKIDISNPTQPVLVSRAEFAIQEATTNNQGETLLGFTFEEKTRQITTEDRYYDEILNDGVVYFDFARNAIPKSAVPASFAGSSAGQVGTVNRVAKLNDHVYVISNRNMIAIDDRDFATNFSRSRAWIEDMETIFPYRDHLFIGSRTSMTIYNTDDPMRPQQDYFFAHATSCDPVLPHNNAVYITLRTGDFAQCPGDVNSLVVLDAQNLDRPQEVMDLEMSSPFGMSVIGNYLFVGEGENGLKVFDISDNLRPRLERSYSDVVAYDIIADPNDPNHILIAGPNGLQQFTSDQSLNLSLNSVIRI